MIDTADRKRAPDASAATGLRCLASRPPLPPNAALRWGVVKPIVQRLHPASVLEIGCGQGAFGARLASMTKSYLAVEPDPVSFATAKPRIAAAGGECANCSAESLSKEKRYDLVCAFEVVEHLADDAERLSAWRELVAPGGSILISVPAWQDRFNAWDALVGHYRRYSPADCCALLESAGFSAPTITLYGWPLVHMTERVRARVAQRRLESLPGTENNASMSQRTARSGRLLQPRSLLGLAGEFATMPFCAMQRMQPNRGTGIVALATRSTDA